MIHSPTFVPFIRADGLSRSFGDHHVLTDVSFTVHAGARAGLIGQNGSGKTTLLRLLAHVDAPDAGAVLHPSWARVGLLWQDLPIAPSLSLAHAFDHAQEEHRAIRERVETASRALAEDPHNALKAASFEEALEAAERAEVWTLEARREEMTFGLGLSEINTERPVGSLSGGQRSRLMLAMLLLSSPDVLLLDEPTNHLDDEAAQFLAQILNSWEGPVIAASHDRAFLDDIATEILDLDPVPHVRGDPATISSAQVSGLTRTRGRYSDHVLARLNERESWEEQYAAEQAELKRLRSRTKSDQHVGHAGRPPRSEARASKKFYSDRNARVVKRRVDDAQRRHDTLSATQVRRPPRELVFRGLTVAGRPTGADNAAIHARGVAVRGRLHPVDVTVGPGESLLVIGPNGSGKSTLLGVLAGVIESTSGSINRSGRVAFLAQDAPGWESGASVEQAYAQTIGAQRALQVPATTFGLLHQKDLVRPVNVLSTGVLRRLDLATILASPAEILVLDEPTNHLSLDLATALEAELGAYPGIVVVASHDRWLRQHWTGRVLDLSGGPSKEVAGL